VSKWLGRRRRKDCWHLSPPANSTQLVVSFTQLSDPSFSLEARQVGESLGGHGFGVTQITTSHCCSRTGAGSDSETRVPSRCGTEVLELSQPNVGFLLDIDREMSNLRLFGTPEKARDQGV
jgi:hypothetical protein